MTEHLGIFKKLPRDLRIWLFAIMDQRAISKLRFYDNIKPFIDGEVYPYIERQLEVFLKNNEKYGRLKSDLYCKKCDCYDNSIGGVQEKFVYTFDLNPDQLQPSGVCNVSKMFDSYIEHQAPISNTSRGSARMEFETGFLKPGICYRCILIDQ